MPWPWPRVPMSAGAQTWRLSLTLCDRKEVAVAGEGQGRSGKACLFRGVIKPLRQRCVQDPRDHLVHWPHGPERFSFSHEVTQQVAVKSRMRPSVSPCDSWPWGDERWVLGVAVHVVAAADTLMLRENRGLGEAGVWWACEPRGCLRVRPEGTMHRERGQEEDMEPDGEVSFPQPHSLETLDK